jgi:DNA-binding transcriptional regulator YiaG
VSNHPNRGKSAARNPKPAEIRALRESAGLSQAEAGAMVHTTGEVWKGWETEDGSVKHRRMHPAFWELFRRKLGV